MTPEEIKKLARIRGLQRDMLLGLSDDILDALKSGSESALEKAKIRLSAGVEMVKAELL